MTYWLYINRTRKRACWHLEGCGRIKQHGGDAAVADQEWIACETLEEVKRTLRAKTHGFPPDNVDQFAACGRRMLDQ